MPSKTETKTGRVDENDASISSYPEMLSYERMGLATSTLAHEDDRLKLELASFYLNGVWTEVVTS